MAVLDVDFGNGTSLAVADELTKLGVPFVFSTDHGDTVMMSQKLRDVPVVRRPYTADSHKAALECRGAKRADGARGGKIRVAW